jgi:c-di-GMP-binding flagellar brake protein YcgR
VALSGSQTAKGEGKPQPTVSGEAGLLDATVWFYGWFNMTIMEKRKFPRLPLNVNVKCEVLNVSTLRAEEIRAKNISAGGICLVVPEKVNIDTLLKLKLSLSGEAMFIIVKGKVVWVEEFSVTHTSDYKAYDCGIEFVDVGPQDQKNISRYLIAPLRQ